jgi:cell division protein YceG involved in septum cleavage
MKKLWNHYSYAIILIGLSCISAFIISFHFHSFEKENYVKVTITEGDSLWKIAENYSDDESLSKKEFISWVKKHNTIHDEQIYPGDEIFIPVTKHKTVTTELASAAE